MAIDLWRTRPFNMTGAMGRAVDRLFEEAFAPFYGGRDGGNSSASQTTGVQSLPVTIWETNDAFHAALMAPGLDENSINVTVQEDTVSVEGELTFQTPEDARMIWQEFAPMRFRRSLRFGTPIDPNRVEAVYRNGLLLITLPKSESAKPRQVRVQVAEGSSKERQQHDGQSRGERREAERREMEGNQPSA
jgi:HSP20 family protein